MFDPTIDIILFISGAFMLGLALGAAIWKLGLEEKLNVATAEVDFWKQHLNQTRQENYLDKSKIDGVKKGQDPLQNALEAHKAANAGT